MMAPLMSVTMGGKTFKTTRRTHDHLKRTQRALRIRHPRAKLHIIQACYNTSIPASAGTHDFDCTFDVEITGISWLQAQMFLRKLGWAAWWRHTGSWEDEQAWHIHMISIPRKLPNNHPTDAQVLAAFVNQGQRVGRFVPGQVSDYYVHAEGLKGQHDPGSDPTWHPKDINATVFRQSWRP